MLFFEVCMSYFDQQEPDNLIDHIFRQRLGASSKHTSYLPFRERKKEVSQKGQPSIVSGSHPLYFGPPIRVDGKGKRRAVSAPDQSHRVDDRRQHVLHVKREQESTARNAGARPDEHFALERYCDACLVRGTELYIRLAHDMLKDNLDKIRTEEHAWIAETGEGV